MGNLIKLKLKGEQLSSVEFVQDYLQLHFDGRILTAYIWPNVIVNGELYIYGDLNYRNKLCELISKIIVDVIIKEKKEFKIIFEGTNIIQIDLNPNNPNIISEIAVFTDNLAPPESNWFIFE